MGREREREREREYKNLEKKACLSPVRNKFYARNRVVSTRN